MKPKKIIIHHSLTEDSGTVSWSAIRRYHTQNKGWSDCGYHAGVELVKTGGDGTIEAFIGRPWDVPGAHARGQNYGSLGICFVGNYDLEEPSEDRLFAGGKVIRMWMRMYNIPLSEIYPHRHFADYKTCPGRKFDMDRLKDVIEHG